MSGAPSPVPRFDPLAAGAPRYAGPSPGGAPSARPAAHAGYEAATNVSCGLYPADPILRSRLADLGFEFFPRDKETPEALAAMQKADTRKWWPIIKEFGIRAE